MEKEILQGNANININEVLTAWSLPKMFSKMSEAFIFIVP